MQSYFPFPSIREIFILLIPICQMNYLKSMLILVFICAIFLLMARAMDDPKDGGKGKEIGRRGRLPTRQIEIGTSSGSAFRSYQKLIPKSGQIDQQGREKDKMEREQRKESVGETQGMVREEERAKGTETKGMEIEQGKQQREEGKVSTNNNIEEEEVPKERENEGREQSDQNTVRSDQKYGQEDETEFDRRNMTESDQGGKSQSSQSEKAGVDREEEGTANQGNETEADQGDETGSDQGDKVESDQGNKAGSDGNEEELPLKKRRTFDKNTLKVRIKMPANRAKDENKEERNVREKGRKSSAASPSTQKSTNQEMDETKANEKKEKRTKAARSPRTRAQKSAWSSAIGQFEGNVSRDISMANSESKSSESTAKATESSKSEKGNTSSVRVRGSKSPQSEISRTASGNSKVAESVRKLSLKCPESREHGDKSIRTDAGEEGQNPPNQGTECMELSPVAKGVKSRGRTAGRTSSRSSNKSKRDGLSNSNKAHEGPAESGDAMSVDYQTAPTPSTGTVEAMDHMLPATVADPGSTVVTNAENSSVAPTDGTMMKTVADRDMAEPSAKQQMPPIGSSAGHTSTIEQDGTNPIPTINFEELSRIYMSLSPESLQAEMQIQSDDVRKQLMLTIAQQLSTVYSTNPTLKDKLQQQQQPPRRSENTPGRTNVELQNQPAPLTHIQNPSPGIQNLRQKQQLGQQNLAHNSSFIQNSMPGFRPSIQSPIGISHSINYQTPAGNPYHNQNPASMPPIHPSNNNIQIPTGLARPILDKNQFGVRPPAPHQLQLKRNPLDNNPNLARPMSYQLTNNQILSMDHLLPAGSIRAPTTGFSAGIEHQASTSRDSITAPYSAQNTNPILAQPPMPQHNPALPIHNFRPLSALFQQHLASQSTRLPHSSPSSSNASPRLQNSGGTSNSANNQSAPPADSNPSSQNALRDNSSSPSEIAYTVRKVISESIEALDLRGIQFGLSSDAEIKIYTFTLRTEGPKLFGKIIVLKGNPENTAEYVIGFLRLKLLDSDDENNSLKIDREWVQMVLDGIEEEVADFEQHIVPEGQSSDHSGQATDLLDKIRKELKFLFVYMRLYGEMMNLLNGNNTDQNHQQMDDGHKGLWNWMGKLRVDIGTALVSQARNNGYVKVVKWVEALYLLGDALSLLNLNISISLPPSTLEGDDEAIRRPTSVIGLFSIVDKQALLNQFANQPAIGDRIQEQRKCYPKRIMDKLSELFDKVSRQCQTEQLAMVPYNLILHLAVSRQLLVDLANPLFGLIRVQRLREERDNAKEYLNGCVALLDEELEKRSREGIGAEMCQTPITISDDEDK